MKTNQWFRKRAVDQIARKTKHALVLKSHGLLELKAYDLYCDSLPRPSIAYPGLLTLLIYFR